MRYNRKQAQERFQHLYVEVPGDECFYCGMPKDGVDHRPAIFTLHKFAKSRMVTRREIHEHFGQCRLVPSCVICNMGIGSYEGENDNDRRQEILNFIDLYDDFGPNRNEWNFGVFTAAAEMLIARDQGMLTDEVYAVPLVGRLVVSHALWVKMGNAKDDEFWQRHRRKLAEWLTAQPRRKAKHFLDMARLESYSFKNGVFGRD